MADDAKKATYLESNAYITIGDGRLEPGGRLLLDEDNTAHKFLKAQVESGNPDYAHLSLVEVDHKAEAKQAEEKAEMLEKAAELASEQRNEEARAASEQLQEQQEAQDKAREEGQPGATEGTAFPPQDEEAISLAKQSGAAQRATTDEDVVEESGGKSGRRSKRS